MIWSLIILTVVTIFISLFICFYNENNGYYHYEKISWANNVEILSILSVISLLLISYACQLGTKFNKSLFLLMCLILISILVWIYNITSSGDFMVTKLSSWSIFLFAITITILLGFLKDTNLVFLSLPFLFSSLLVLYGSYDIIDKNLENPFKK